MLYESKQALHYISLDIYIQFPYYKGHWNHLVKLLEHNYTIQWLHHIFFLRKTI